ncbi:unnamed protein product [Parnassius mnemosyne]|uniref:Transposase n=1 Tax=Parnassius mnemosyne TaxID=213953 RepID=A0AAV1LN73_9NEOP
MVNILDDLSLVEYRRTWFQHDGAPPHVVRFVCARLTELFDDHWIGRQGPHAWPPRSPDLTPLDFFLWGYVKERVFNRKYIQHLEEKACSKPHPNLESLKTSLIKAATDIDMDLVRAAIADWPRRLKACIQNQEGHFE